MPDKVRAAVERSDLGLDADLAAGVVGTRPHLRLLGPIQARTGTTGKPTAVAKRKAFYTELLAFLVLHPQGVTIDQVVDAFGSDATQMRVHLSKVRSWLGLDPMTGGQYLPEATKSPAGIEQGMGIYQLVGVLADIDLFRRLLARGQSGGPEGLVDLRATLELVTGEPSTGQRGRGWPTVSASISTWRAQWSTWPTRSPSRPSMRATCSWPAPLPGSRCLRPVRGHPTTRPRGSRGRRGRPEAAERMLRDDNSNRADDGDAPEDLPERTAELVASAPRLKKGRVA